MVDKVIFFISLVTMSDIFGMSPRYITPASRNVLIGYAASFLGKNFNKIVCQKNESGFVRINIPVLKEFKNIFPTVRKIRLNYWTPESEVIINPESIHNHPSYFESLIIKGGYTHQIYRFGDNKDAPYDLYTLVIRKHSLFAEKQI